MYMDGNNSIVAETKSEKFFRRSGKYKAWFCIAPAFFFLMMFTYYPMLRVLWDSFFSNQLGSQSSVFAGLDNYRRLFDDPEFIISVKNNVIYAIGTIIPSLALGLGFALALVESSRFKNFVRAILFFPTLVPLIAASALWVFIYFPGIGLLDYYLHGFCVCVLHS
ncbi:MAG: hypothetical protein DSY90_03605 [Deltaproteobacteria bacterium]|nr:MAG: hypothetical protein DSY90_03605 [Deltaproteobacteria bacterium]